MGAKGIASAWARLTIKGNATITTPITAASSLPDLDYAAWKSKLFHNWASLR